RSDSPHAFSPLPARATTARCALALHDALPICSLAVPTPGGPVPVSQIAMLEYAFEDGIVWHRDRLPTVTVRADIRDATTPPTVRSEEHTSELQSREKLVCRLLLEKKKHLRMPQ